MPPRRMFGIMRMARFLCVTPWYNRKEKTFNEKTWWRTYQMCDLAFIAVTYFALFYHFETVIGKKLQPHEKLILQGVNITLYLVNLMASVRNVFTKRTQWKGLIKKLVAAVENLHDIGDVVFSSYLSYIFKHALLVINMVFLILSQEAGVFLVIFSQLPYIQLTLFVLAVEDIGTMLKLIFRQMNEILRRELDTEIKIEKLDLVPVETDVEERPEAIAKRTKTIQRLINIYSDCCDVIDFYNDIFGWIVVFICLFTVIGVLPGLENIIWKIIPNNYSHLDTVIWRINNSILRLFICVLLIKSCHGATEEGDTIKINATNALQMLPLSKRYDGLRRELNLLVDLTESYPPKFSAAGVFPVDNSLFYVLFTTITSYLVVLIQFIQSPIGDVPYRRRSDFESTKSP